MLRGQRSTDTVRLLLAALLVLGISGLETLHPGGWSLFRLTRGLVTLDLLIRAGIFTIILVGLNLLMGYAGQVSLGQAAFYGMGAFFSAVLTVRASALGIPASLAEAWWWAWILIPSGAVLVGAVAYPIGLTILRLRGHYLAMATLGMGVVVFIVLRENLGLPHLNLTGGFDGVFGIRRLRLATLEVWPAPRYFLLVWTVALSAIALGINIVHSRIGRALRAIHGSEPAASSLGVAVPHYKAEVFALSAMLASLAGGLYAHFQAAVVPATFGFVPSLELVVMSTVGGMTNVWGAPVGALTILLLKEILHTQLPMILPEVKGEIAPIVFGILLVLVMRFWPQGITGRGLGWFRASAAAPR